MKEACWVAAMDGLMVAWMVCHWVVKMAYSLVAEMGGSWAARMDDLTVAQRACCWVE